MTGKITISVSGGVAAFGAVNAGDGARISAQATALDQRQMAAFDGAARALLEKAAREGIDATAQQAALDHVEALKQAGAEGAPEPGRVARILDAAKAHQEWAYPILRDVAKAVWPVVMAAL